MEYAEAEKIMEKMFEEERAVSKAKGTEYTQGKDRLDNFKRLSVDVGIDPKAVLWIYLKKHLDSISSYIRQGRVFSNEPIQGRIMDARVYLFLLRCMIEEEEAAKKTGNGQS